MSAKILLPTVYITASGAFTDAKESDMVILSGSDLNTQEESSSHIMTQLAEHYENAGADGVIFYDLSSDDLCHEKFIKALREISRRTDIDIFAGGHIKRLEDVKKYLYAGAHTVIINKDAKDSLTGSDIAVEAGERFGVEKTAVRDEDGNVVLNDGIIRVARNTEDINDVLTSKLTVGVTGPSVSGNDFDFYGFKAQCLKNGIEVRTFTPTEEFSSFKCNEQGLIPVIVQDYKTDEVLMMAWMNEESFDKTVATGLMTYYSRSRGEIWVKGETSGHFQYVRSMAVDCDRDTLLARVKQVGAACHTGNKTCFYTELFSKTGDHKNPLKVFTDVYDVIEDRKNNPKEGSYTTYLFEQGIDKVLKKCGEEAAEVIIAAKNTDPEEIKYEMADFLYHAMVLMSMKGVTWEDITRELANR